MSKNNRKLIAHKPERFATLRRAARKIKSVFAGELLPKSFSSSRRRFFTKGLRYAAAVGITGLAGRLALTEREMAQKHEVIVALDRHEKAVDLDRTRKAISGAKALGSPFHAIGLENAGARKGELKEFIEMYEKVLKVRRGQYARHIGNGMRPRNAEEKLYNDMLEDYKSDPDEDYPEHATAIDFLSFKTGLPIFPIEEYTEQEIADIKEMHATSHELAATAVFMHPTLQEQKEDIERSARLDAHAIRLRNIRIAQTIPKVAALLQQHYPRLPKKGLRLIYALGAGHAADIPSLQHKAEMQLSFGSNHQDLLPAITYKLNNDPQASLTEIERGRLVLAIHLLATLPPDNTAQTSQERAELVSSLAKLTNGDFEHLSQKTANKHPDQKAEIIRSYLLNKQK